MIWTTQKKTFCELMEIVVSRPDIIS